MVLYRCKETYIITVKNEDGSLFQNFNNFPYDLVNSGLTGLYYYSVVFTEAAPSSAELIPNTAITTASSKLTALTSVAKLLFQLYQDKNGPSSSS